MAFGVGGSDILFLVLVEAAQVEGVQVSTN